MTFLPIDKICAALPPYTMNNLNPTLINFQVDNLQAYFKENKTADKII